MRKLLYIGDAVASTGFAKAAHKTLDVLCQTWDVSVLGINYFGTPHDYPYPIWPASGGGDAFGVQEVQRMINRITPDAIWIQNDPWNFPAYLRVINKVYEKADRKPPVIGSVAVDGLNCRGYDLNGLALAIFWTKFGEEQARLGGYTGQSAVVPLGVDLDIFKPADKREARTLMGLPPHLRDVFIAMNVNRNQPRKRLDLTIMYFCEWVKSFNVDDAWLYLHIAPTGEQGFGADQLMQYYGFSRAKTRLITCEPDVGFGATEDRVALTMACADVGITTTQGEGFGLPTLEMMACGVPQIVPDWSALGDWPRDAVVKIPCSTQLCTPNKINVIGGVPDKEAFIKALHFLYQNKQVAATHNDPLVGVREALSQRGVALAAEPQFRWKAIGQAFSDAIDAAVGRSL